MHEFIFFDTETTSLLAAKGDGKGGEVIQFAAIVTDPDFCVTRVINRYCNTTQLIDPSAETVHKLSDKKVALLSGGKYFETVVEEEGLRGVTNATWIAYNLSFDVRMINQTLKQNGYEPLNFGTSVSRLNRSAIGVYRFDAIDPLRSIHRARHRAKLSALISAHIGDDAFKAMCVKFRDRNNIEDPGIGEDGHLHNAIFDTLGLALLVRKYSNLLLA